jgi:hypothetical protein
MNRIASDNDEYNNADKINFICRYIVLNEAIAIRFWN